MCAPKQRGLAADLMEKVVADLVAKWIVHALVLSSA